jgi:hypothetical protein
MSGLSKYADLSLQICLFRNFTSMTTEPIIWLFLWEIIPQNVESLNTLEANQSCFTSQVS